MKSKVVEDIEKAYQKGELDHVKRDLEKFLKLSGNKILNYRLKLSKMFRKKITIENAIKLFLLDQRSINPKTEIEEQLSTIRRYSKKINLTEESASYIWASKFSAGWRDHRTTSIIFVFDKNKSHYLGLLKHNIEAEKD